MEGAYVVVLATSLMLIRGSALSGQRRMQGANTMARELGDMRLCGSSLETLQSVDKTVLKTYNNFVREKKKILFILSSFTFRAFSTRFYSKRHTFFRRNKIYHCWYSKDVHRIKC